VCFNTYIITFEPDFAETVTNMPAFIPGGKLLSVEYWRQPELLIRDPIYPRRDWHVFRLRIECAAVAWACSPSPRFGELERSPILGLCDYPPQLVTCKRSRFRIRLPDDPSLPLRNSGSNTAAPPFFHQTPSGETPSVSQLYLSAERHTVRQRHAKRNVGRTVQGVCRRVSTSKFDMTKWRSRQPRA